MMKKILFPCILALPLVFLYGSEGGERHEVAVARIFIALVVMMIAGKLGGELAERLKQPVVLGELVGGIVLGNLSLFGLHLFDYLKEDFTIAVLAEIGVVLLLFEVGLESNIKEMMEVGASAFLVAVMGVVTPAILGFGVSSWLIPEEPPLAHLFIGAILCATSVGITARVLRDLGKIQTKEARIILGAAVIDDVLGLVILSVASGIIVAANEGGHLNISQVWWIILKAAMLLFGAVVIGQWLSPRLFNLASYLRVKGVLLITSLVVCFFLAWLAGIMGLAPIVGAFAAGLILEDVHFKEFRKKGERELVELLHPISIAMVPLFFVLMGIKVDIRYFGEGRILLFAFFLTVAAILGKQACSLGVLEKGVSRLTVGLGMIPRGEVGLIFAGIGTTLILKGIPVVTPPVFGASVIMVVVTTLVTPPLLKIVLTRQNKKKD